MFHSLADSFPPRILIIVACLISSLMYKEEIQPKLCLLSKIVQIIPVPCPESLGLHLHLKRWAATEMVDYGCSWYTRHGNQLRWLSVCVCVILSYDWTNGLKWQLATMCCNNNDHHRAPHYLCPKGRNVKLCDWSVWQQHVAASCHFNQLVQSWLRMIHIHMESRCDVFCIGRSHTQPFGRSSSSQARMWIEWFWTQNGNYLHDFGQSA